MSPMHALPQALKDDTYLCDIFFLVHGWWVQGPLLLCLNHSDVKTRMHSAPSTNTIFYLNIVQFDGKRDGWVSARCIINVWDEQVIWRTSFTNV